MQEQSLVDEKPHLSFSQINMFLRCPKQWEFRYIQKLKIPPGAALVLGRSWHETIEQNYVQKIQSEADLPLEDMKDFFSDAWTKNLEKEEIDFGEDEPGQLKDLGILITDVHHREVAPKVQPALVEEEFRISLGEEFPYELLGYFDVIERDGTIADNKSWKRSKSQGDVDKDLQLTAYALGYRVKFGRAEKGLRFDAVIKNKKPKAVQLTTTRTNDDCRWLLKLIEKVADGIVKETFYPNPNGWHCDPKWCGYWNKCKGGAR
jgi:RecB family exonuclease